MEGCSWPNGADGGITRKFGALPLFARTMLSSVCQCVCVCALCKFVIEALLAVKLVLAGFVVPQAYIRREMVHSFGTLRGRR